VRMFVKDPITIPERPAGRSGRRIRKSMQFVEREETGLAWLAILKRAIERAFDRLTDRIGKI
jgi:hypothetical protein